MAGPIRCDGCEEAPGTFMLSNVENGDTQSLCGPCLASFGLVFAKEVLPPELIAQTLGPIFVEVGKGKPGPKRKRDSEPEPEPEATEPEPGPEAAEGLEEVEAAASDG